MIPLPSSCIGCPFYQYHSVAGNGFVPDSVVENSQVYILGQNPGADEVEGRQLVNRIYTGYGKSQDEYKRVTPQPLIGATGKLFTERFLPLSKLRRDQVSLGNAIRCRPGIALGKKADELPLLTSTMHLDDSKAPIVAALKHCRDAHFHPPSSVSIVVTMGRYATFLMTGLAKEESEYSHRYSMLESWRGYGLDTPSWHINKSLDISNYHDLTSTKRVFVMLHTAALFRDKKYYHAALQDFHKLGLLLNNTWPIPLPVWSNKLPDTWPIYSSFDTEYYPETNQLIRWSLCDSKNNLYCIEAEDTPPSGIPIQQKSTVLMQNALADISHLQLITDMSQVNIEDMMLAHSVLWTGEPHSLNYIASIYGAFNRYKHLMNDTPQLYSALDAYEPMYIWKNYMLPEFKRDKESWRVYKKYRLPLIDIINKAQLSGIKVDTGRLAEVQHILTERLQTYTYKAQSLTGDFELNLGGRVRMLHHIYGTPLPEKKKVVSKRKKDILQIAIATFMEQYTNGEVTRQG